MFDPQEIKRDFPILTKQVHGKPLIYLDNGASSQKPQAVLDAIVEYYTRHYANVHRGVHQLSDESTGVWENSKKIIADFFGAQTEELIMVRNTTEALNGIAYGWGSHNLKAGDVILTTVMEHHSNFVTWQELAKSTGAELKVVAVDAQGRIDLKKMESLLSTKVKLIALGFVSNVTGTVNPIKKIVEMSRKVHARVVVDAAQAAPHLKINFASSGVDFMAISGHKMLGPMGAGVLLVKKQLLELEEMKPWLFGGGMINDVTIAKATYHQTLSERFTAGTPDVASAVGLAAACQYLSRIGMDEVEQHDRNLVAYTLEQLATVPEVSVIGPTLPLQPNQELDRVGSVAFIYNGVHAHDVAQVLDSEGIAVRSGHHCTQPLHDACGWQATIRISFQVYNTIQDIDVLINALSKVKKVFNV